MEKSAAPSSISSASLGDYAEIAVPAGYQFISAIPARLLLERMNNPIAPGLLGILAPENGKWMAVLEFDEIGCMKSLDGQKPDTAAILKALQDRYTAASAQEAARIASVKWQIEPSYDAAAHSLEWSLRAQTRSGEVLNHSVALLGRRGVLEVTVVQPYFPGLSPVRLDKLVKTITFKADERYEDYRSGDKLASAGFKELILGEPQPVARPENHETAVATASIPHLRAWVCAGIGGVSVVGLVFVALKKPKSSKSKSRPVVAANGHAVPVGHINGNGNGNGHANGNGHSNGNGARKKKRIHYSKYCKYYSEMVLGLSGNVYKPASSGNGENHRSVHAAEPIGRTAIGNVNLELIASQKNIIEEQRNIMREQSRLIEEKARLLKEYNLLVDKWSQDMENQFSLKLD